MFKLFKYKNGKRVEIIALNNYKKQIELEMEYLKILCGLDTKPMTLTIDLLQDQLIEIEEKIRCLK